MPEHVRDWVADELGSPVVEAADQVGGMSPGCATRLVCEDGTRAFVKAVGLELNPRTPVLFRREITALTPDRLARALGGPAGVVRRRRLGRDPARGRRGHPPRPRRRRDDGHPAPGDRAAGPGAGRAGPRPTGTGRRTTAVWRDLRQGFHEWARRRRPRRRDPAATCCPTGSAATPATWEPLVRALADHDVRLVHFDIRNDNLLERPTGELVFLDWGARGDRAAAGWTRCSPGSSGSRARGSTRRWPPPPLWPRPATRPWTPGWSGSRRSSPGGRTPPWT